MFIKLRILLSLAAIVGAFCGIGSAFAMRTNRSPGQDQQTGQSPAEEAGGLSSKRPESRDLIEARADHGASVKCAQCHGNHSEPTSSVEAELVAPVPRLCFTCHEEYAALDGWVHGPVVTGDCLFCHDPHWSNNGSLLTKPVPELCHQCHTIETLQLVKNHSDESHQRCDDCHESHAGSNRKLLTQGFLRTEAGAGYGDQEVYRRPQYTFVDRRSSLAGSRGVRVIPTIERQDMLSHYGLTPDLVKMEIERCLRQRGIRIIWLLKPRPLAV